MWDTTNCKNIQIIGMSGRDERKRGRDFE